MQEMLQTGFRGRHCSRHAPLGPNGDFVGAGVVIYGSFRRNLDRHLVLGKRFGRKSFGNNFSSWKILKLAVEREASPVGRSEDQIRHRKSVFINILVSLLCV
jgi:hypothetical protein